MIALAGLIAGGTCGVLAVCVAGWRTVRRVRPAAVADEAEAWLRRITRGQS